MPRGKRSAKKKAHKASKAAAKRFPKKPVKAVAKCPNSNGDDESEKLEIGYDALEGGVSLNHKWVEELEDGAQINNKILNLARNATGNKEWLKIGEWNREVSSGIEFDPEENAGSLDVIKAEASFAVAEAAVESESRFHEAEASLKVLSAEAEMSLGGEISESRQELYAKAGGSIDLIKGSVSAGIKIPLWGGHEITIGGTGEGQVGASVEASAHIGGDQDKGYSMGMKGKLGFGLGLGLEFNISIK